VRQDCQHQVAHKLPEAIHERFFKVHEEPFKIVKFRALEQEQKTFESDEEEKSSQYKKEGAPRA
jgi:hypothetical protein